MAVRVAGRPARRCVLFEYACQDDGIVAVYARTRADATSLEGEIMNMTQSLVVLTDEGGNRYGFTLEQLADAKLTDGNDTSDFSVKSQLVSVGSELNGRPDARW